MAIQARIILDSGAFLTDEESEGFLYSDVGYFEPMIQVNADGTRVSEIDLKNWSGSSGDRIVEVRCAGRPPGILFHHDLVLVPPLSISELYGNYGDHRILADRTAYDFIFRFSSGRFLPSNIKRRKFIEIDARSDQTTGNAKIVRPIAHDIIVEYDLGPGDELQLVNDGRVIWTSFYDPEIKDRLEIKILTGDSTAEKFYRHALRLEGRNYWLPNPDDPPPHDFKVTRTAGRGGSTEDSKAVEDEAVSFEPSRKPRHFNAGFFGSDSDDPISEYQALALDAGPYRLGVNIGEFWGVGAPDVPFPEGLIKEYFKNEKALQVDVIVRSSRVKFDLNRRRLGLTETDDSHMIFFGLTLSKAGLHSIDIDLLFRGNLLQSRRVEFEVRALLGDSPSKAGDPAQTSRITFTRTETLSDHQMNEMRRRAITIVTQRDPTYATIKIHFYDWTGADDDAAPAEMDIRCTKLNDSGLTNLLLVARKRLVQTMTAYSPNVGGQRDLLRKHLGLLADVGRTFYRELMTGRCEAPDDEQDEHNDEQKDEQVRMVFDLPFGTIIQAAPLSSQLGVPWELLYEREFETYKEDRTKLCETFLEHGAKAEECPSHNDSKVVCPYGFWGYRYIIEQLPLWIEPNKPPAAGGPSLRLPLFVHNGKPLRLSVGFSRTLELFESHFSALRGLAPEADLKLDRADRRDAVRDVITKTDDPSDVIYFYAHGGTDDLKRPYLEVGKDDQIKSNDLDAWRVAEAWRRNLPLQPFVILNACESAAYAPDSFESLIKFFCDAGASGVIAAQCDVRQRLASEFTMKFFKAFLRQVPAGQAMFEARQELLKLGDPRGLVYSLFASADVQLAQPITD